MKPIIREYDGQYVLNIGPMTYDVTEQMKEFVRDAKFAQKLEDSHELDEVKKEWGAWQEIVKLVAPYCQMKG